MSKLSLPYNPQLVERARELRSHMTPAERRLWYDYLCNFRYRVLRQRPIDQYIVDFYCDQLQLVIEVDGITHSTPDEQAYDQHRSDRLQGYGLKVLRFSNTEVLENLGEVCLVIEDFARGVEEKGRG